MADTLKNIIVIGASGNVGPHIVCALTSDPQFKVTVLSREGSKATFPSGVQVARVPGSFPENALIKAFQGQDAVVNLAPLNDVDLHKRIVDAAVATKVKRFIPNDFGSKSDQAWVMEHIGLLFGNKIVVKDYLRSKGKGAPSWTSIVNGNLFELNLRSGFHGFDQKDQTAQIFGDGNAKTDLVLLSDVGIAVAHILKNPKKTENRFVHINSFYASQNIVLAALEAATGTKWKAVHLDPEKAQREGRAQIEQNDWSDNSPGKYVMGFLLSGDDRMREYGSYNHDNQLLLGHGTRDDSLVPAIVAKVVKGEEVWSV